MGAAETAAGRDQGSTGGGLMSAVEPLSRLAVEPCQQGALASVCSFDPSRSQAPAGVPCWRGIRRSAQRLNGSTAQRSSTIFVSGRGLGAAGLGREPGARGEHRTEKAGAALAARPQLYVYRWCPKVWGSLRGFDRKGQLCRIIQRLAMNSAVVRFESDGGIEVISRNALRRARGESCLSAQRRLF